MMMIALNSFACQKKRVQGEEETGDQRKTGQTGIPTPGADTPTSLVSVRGVGCKEQVKRWTVVWGSTPQEGQRRLGISPFLSR